MYKTYVLNGGGVCVCVGGGFSGFAKSIDTCQPAHSACFETFCHMKFLCNPKQNFMPLFSWLLY